MDGLTLVVVLGVSLAIGARQGLGGFVGFEAEVTLLVFVGAGFVAEAGVAQHEVVVGLQVFRVDRERLLEFFHRVPVALLQEEDAAEFVVDDAIARELREDGLQNLRGLVVVALFFQDTGVEEIGARQIGFQSEGFEKNDFCAFGVAFLDADSADVGPTVEIAGRHFGDFGEGLLGAAEIALEEEANAVVVPAGPVVFAEADLRSGRGGGVRKDADGLGIFGDGDDREIGNGFGFGGDVGEITGELPLAVVVILGDIAGLIGIRRAGEGEMGVPPLEFAVVEFGMKRDVFAGAFGDVQAEVGGVGGARRDEVDVDDGAGGPGVALVDGMIWRDL